MEAPGYTGLCGIFGGRDFDCPNCIDREPYNVLVDITDTLYQMNASRYDIDIKYVCFDEEGEYFTNEDAIGVPVPIIDGPYFEKNDENL